MLYIFKKLVHVYHISLTISLSYFLETDSVSMVTIGVRQSVQTFCKQNFIHHECRLHSLVTLMPLRYCLLYTYIHLIARLPSTCSNFYFMWVYANPRLTTTTVVMIGSHWSLQIQILGPT